VKGLALGARAVFSARAIAGGLAVEGGQGVRGVLELLRAELELTLGLLGCTGPEQVTRSHIAPTVPYDPAA
jgi:(S)-2-hydroxy-acid oxidase